MYIYFFKISWLIEVSHICLYPSIPIRNPYPCMPPCPCCQWPLVRLICMPTSPLVDISRIYFYQELTRCQDGSHNWEHTRAPERSTSSFCGRTSGVWREGQCPGVTHRAGLDSGCPWAPSATGADILCSRPLIPPPLCDPEQTVLRMLSSPACPGSSPTSWPALNWSCPVSSSGEFPVNHTRQLLNFPARSSCKPLWPQRSSAWFCLVVRCLQISEKEPAPHAMVFLNEVSFYLNLDQLFFIYF